MNGSEQCNETWGGREGLNRNTFEIECQKICQIESNARRNVRIIGQGGDPGKDHPEQSSRDGNIVSVN